MTFSVELVDPLVEAVPPEWDGLVEKAGLPAVWRADVLRALAWCVQHPTVLGVVIDPVDGPVALFHGRALGLPADLRRFVALPARRSLGLLECRLPPTYSLPGHAFADGLDEAGRAGAVSAFERAVRRRLGAATLGVAFRQVSPADLEAFRPGRMSLAVVPEIVLANRWDDLEGYFAALSPNQRSALRRLRRRVRADETVRVGWEPAIDPAEASRLANAVRRKHRSRHFLSAPIPAPYFAALADAASADYLTYREPGGRLLAYAMLLDDGADLFSTIWGSRDLRDGGRRDLYFDQIPEMVDRMIRTGRRRILLGKGMNDVKLRLGGTESALYLVASVRPPSRG